MLAAMLAVLKAGFAYVPLDPSNPAGRLQAILADADVSMALRIQRERIGNLDGIPGIDEYFATYGVSHESMKYARPDAIVMHPGPMNRGIEIEGSLADGPSSMITKQVRNGVAVRMAVLDRVAKAMAARQ